MDHCEYIITVFVNSEYMLYINTPTSTKCTCTMYVHQVLFSYMFIVGENLGTCTGTLVKIHLFCTFIAVVIPKKMNTCRLSFYFLKYSS